MTDPKALLEAQKQQFVDQAKDKAVNPLPVIQTKADLESETAYPKAVADFSAWLIRQGYIRTVADLLPAAWRGMTDKELTAYLAARYTEEDLKKMFLMPYAEREAVKIQFRRGSIIAAIVIGLIWARENIKEGEWSTAAMKVGGTALSAYALNKILYARDPTAEAIMATRAGDFGRWFKGVARTNTFVNLLTEAMIVADLAQLFKSGGYDLPSIPWDIIHEIDIEDPKTWSPPQQVLLDLGFNIWYRQKCTKEHPEACNAFIYLGYIEGSLVKTILYSTILTKSAE
jgi:hypothetical protein